MSGWSWNSDNAEWRKQRNTYLVRLKLAALPKVNAQFLDIGIDRQGSVVRSEYYANAERHRNGRAQRAAQSPELRSSIHPFSDEKLLGLASITHAAAIRLYLFACDAKQNSGFDVNAYLIEIGVSKQ